jgi:hypothetical protein
MNVRHFYLGNYTGGGISWAQQGVEIGQMGGQSWVCKRNLN